VSTEVGGEAPERAPGQKSLTIGGVCKQLEREFPEISISKIRYLEDQKLLAPRRTQGGYRLYSPDDVERLRTILRLQRDEFLPLRVIRQELAAGRADQDVAGPKGPDPRALRRATVEVKGPGSLYGLEQVIDDTGADASLVKELEDYGVIKGEKRNGETLYDDTEREIIRATALLEQILAPALRSRNPERRKEAVEALENLAAIASHLKHLLLIRDLRKLTR
jgi:DNA-binding transcriptional MerR regulator